MTAPELGRWLHLGGGFAAVGLGLAVMLLPKRGPRAGWHRNLGRVYAAVLAAASLLGSVLAWRNGNAYLVGLGVITFLLIAQGWSDARAARAAFRRGDTAAGRDRLRWHLIFMGASYIGAWSGFFATNPIFGVGQWWQPWAYVLGPPAVGAVVIAQAARRWGPPRTSGGGPASVG